MILNAEPIQPLNIIRKESYYANGGAEFAYMGGPQEDFGKYFMRLGPLVGTICSVCCSGKAKAFSLKINEEAIRNIKEKEKLEGQVDFVSTNDVIVSKIGNALKPRVLDMPMQLRGRIPDVEKNDCGNYATHRLLFPPDYVTPALVRRSITPEDGQIRRHGQPALSLPGCCEAARSGTLTMIVNWAALGTPNVSGCELLIHEPVIPSAPWNYFNRSAQSAGPYSVDKRLQGNGGGGRQGGKLARNTHEYSNILDTVALFWDHFGANSRPGPPSRPLRSHVTPPKGPNEPPKCSKDTPRGAIWSEKEAKGRAQSAKWTPKGSSNGAKLCKKPQIQRRKTHQNKHRKIVPKGFQKELKR